MKVVLFMVTGGSPIIHETDWRMAEYTDHNDFWLRLDNAAKIYPAVRDNELTAVFRITVELKERIKAKQLLEAINMLEERFPYYKVKLKAGFFWYYLEPNNLPIAVEPDQGIPCRAFEKNELMFRVLAANNRLSVEFSHILTDGTGALEFLKTLLIIYLQKCGFALQELPSFLRPEDKPGPEEYEDAYNRHFKKIEGRPVKVPKAFHVPFSLKSKPRFDILTAIIPLASIITKAKSYEVSLTAYLTAVYLYALQEIYQQSSNIRKRVSHKIARIEIPVNLRKIFPSATMRNFSLYVIPGIDFRLGGYSFEEIVKTVYHQTQLETDKKLVGKNISRNVSGEKNPWLRRVPLFIKSWILSKLYNLGTSQYSGVVTNLGKIDLLAPTNNLVKTFSFTPPPPNKILKINCGVAGFENKLIITFGNITQSKELERQFLTFLVKEGITVQLAK
jgi:NRPS condensation-like uncharacterized protein